MYRSIVIALIIAGALIGPASAVAGVAPTNLTIHADDSHVYGKLTGRPACREGQTIRLVVNGTEIATTSTDADGSYAFDHELVPREEVYTRFDGSITGSHPDTLICMASASRVLRFVPGAGSAGPSSARAAAFDGSLVGVATIGLGETLATWLRGGERFDRVA